jgi:flagellar hook protein FlgE
MDADGTINTKGRVFDGALLTFDGDTGKFDNVNSSTSVTLSGLGTNFSDISIDFSECSMYDNKGTSTIGATSGDLDGLGTGRRLGDMIGVSIQNNGMIYASYDNGMTRLLGQIATANFANASGLEKEGDNLYSATLNSGEFDGIGVDVTANGGYMSTGQLEMSNVDLSTEFTEMITTQRGFQANSRIITVSDTLLEELTNLKR